MIKIEEFLTRTSRSKADLLRTLGEDPKSSILSAYASGRSKPSFEMCQKLMLQGMSISELFGDEVDEKIKRLYSEAVINSESQNPRDVVVNGLKAVLAELEAKTEPLTETKPNPFLFKTAAFRFGNRRVNRNITQRKPKPKQK